LTPLLSDAIERELQPIFETRVERLIMPLRFGRSNIELALDCGRINTPGHHLSISEFEIELKDGDRRDIAMLARRLVQALDLSCFGGSHSLRSSMPACGRPWLSNCADWTKSFVVVRCDTGKASSQT